VNIDLARTIYRLLEGHLRLLDVEGALRWLLPLLAAATAPDLVIGLIDCNPAAFVHMPRQRCNQSQSEYSFISNTAHIH
jgi:hypothetical protein